MDKTLYFCVGCREIHFDEDFCEKDGDLEIFEFDRFLKSVERVKSTQEVKA